MTRKRGQLAREARRAARQVESRSKEADPRQKRIQQSISNYLKAVDNAERPLKNLGPEFRSMAKAPLSPEIKRGALAASKAHSAAVKAIDDLYKAILMIQNAVKQG